MISRLRAPRPGWSADTDVLIVGSGIAGLSTALQITRQSSLRVTLVTKDVLSSGSTGWAQGGIAAALDEHDSPDEHYADTIEAGVGLCDEAAVRLLVREGPAAVRDLQLLGTRFDRARDGQMSLTREGGHRRDRIAHAGGDATGAEIERALVTRVLDASGVRVIEHALVLDLAQSSGRVAGASLHVMGEGARDGVGAIRARAVVLASGGFGQVFASTTNPAVSTGDGVAAALRAGAVVRDLEFVQFHPTVAYLGDAARGQQPLVSEAVRGEGAVLVDSTGVAFMAGVHELADLAPRDVVAKAIMARMLASGAPNMWLDARSFGAAKWRRRFPTIYATLCAHGIDPALALIPVVPAAHYVSGGVATDVDGRASLPGLFACGEVACSGVHGANRLASNSLLEGLVFGRRIAQYLVGDDLGRGPGADALDSVSDTSASGGLAVANSRPPLQELMSRHAGVLRDADGLAAAARGLAELVAEPAEGDGDAASWETTNLHCVATALVSAATRRQETRGSHWRADYPDRDDEHWRRHIDFL